MASQFTMRQHGHFLHAMRLGMYQHLQTMLLVTFTCSKSTVQTHPSLAYASCIGGDEEVQRSDLITIP